MSRGTCPSRTTRTTIRPLTFESMTKRAKIHQHPMKRTLNYAIGRLRTILCICGHMAKEHSLSPWGCKKCQSFGKECEDFRLTGMHGS